MNRVNIIGNLTKDPELRTTTSGTSVCTFTVAVQRVRSTQDGEKQADYINCVAWRKTAENVSKYLSKGKKVGVTGSIQTRSYEKDGHKVFITEVVCDDYGGVEFLSPRGESSGSASSDAAAAAYGATPEPAQSKYIKVEDEELPF